MSNKWKWTLIVALFFSAGITLSFLRAPSDGSGRAQLSPFTSDDAAQEPFDKIDPEVQAPIGPAGPGQGDAVTDNRMYEPEVAQHHLVNPVFRLECENPDDHFDCRLMMVNDHPYYDSARFDNRTLETLAANYDPVAALVLAQRFSFEPDERTRRFLEAATYSGRAGPLIVMVRDFANDPTDLASMVNRCKYLYVATWMGYPFHDDGRDLSSACDKVAALGGDRQVVRKDAQALFSRIEERRRATVGTGPNGGSS